MNRLLQLNVLLMFCLSSCTNNNPAASQTKATNLFFNYDEVEHFHLELANGALENIAIESRFKSLLEVLTQPITSISDSAFFSTLYTYPFKKKLIPNTKFASLDSIFQVKNNISSEPSLCLPTFRDIIIFKKDEHVVGIAKICFECEQHSIVGTKQNTDDFGQSGDYEKLAQLLKN